MQDDNYFESYADLDVHKTMLCDTERLRAYRKAIFSNTKFWKDKVVLDIGAGTGILSVYCAQAGAKKVYAVEASNLTDILQGVIEENDVANVVQVIAGLVENVSLPVETVDVIVSEWMGHYLFHESMLDSVLFARDKYLKEDGFMFPCRCRLFASPCALPEYFDYWTDVTGVKMQSFSNALRGYGNGCSRVCPVDPNYLFAKKHRPILEFDMCTVTVEDVKSISIQSFTVSEKESKLQALCIWFEVLFPAPKSDSEFSLSDQVEDGGAVVLSTSPYFPETHWKQFVIILPEELLVEKGFAIATSLTFERDTANPRKYNISAEFVDADEVAHPNDCECFSTKCALIRQCNKLYSSSS